MNSTNTDPSPKQSVLQRLHLLYHEKRPASNYRFKNICKTSATCTPNRNHTSIIQHPATILKWKQILNDSQPRRERSTLRVKMLLPQQYVTLFTRINTEKRSTRQLSKLGSMKSVCRGSRMSRVEKKMEKQFQKHSVNQLCKQTISILQSASNTKASTDKLVKLIRKSLTDLSMERIFVKKGKRSQPATIVQDYQELHSRVRKYYLSNPDGYFFMHFRQFRNNLQAKINSIDNQMISALQRCLSRLQANQTMREQPSLLRSASNQRLRRPVNILNKIKDCERDYGQFNLISSFNRNRYEAFERINTSLKECEQEYCA